MWLATVCLNKLFSCSASTCAVLARIQGNENNTDCSVRRTFTRRQPAKIRLFVRARYDKGNIFRLKWSLNDGAL